MSVLGELTALSPATIASAGEPERITISSDGLFVYAACRSGNKVSQYSRDPASGKLTALSPAEVAAGEGAYGIAISPDGKHVYVSNSHTTTISQYSRNAETGKLTALSVPTVTVGAESHGLAVSPDGKHVYCSCYLSPGKIYQYSRNESTGELTALSPASVETGVEHPHDIGISSDGKFVYAPCGTSGEGKISQLERNTSTGLLTSLSPSSVGTGAGAEFSETLVISPDGRNVYIANELGTGAVSQFERNQGTGKLTVLSPASLTGGSNRAGVVISPDGATVYVMNEGESALSQYARNESTGKLTAFAVEKVTTGLHPSHGIVSPDNRHMYVANRDAATISQFNRTIYSNTFSFLPPTLKTPRTLFKPFPFAIETPKEIILLSSVIFPKFEVVAPFKVSVKLSSTVTSKFETSAKLVVLYKLPKTTLESKFSLSAPLKVGVKLSSTVESKFSIIAPLTVKSPVKLSSILESKLTVFAPLKVSVKLSSKVETKFSIIAPLLIRVPQRLSSSVELKFSISSTLKNALRLKSILLSEFTVSAPLFVKTENGPNTLIYTGQSLVFPSLSSFETPSVEWRWWLCRSSDLGQITEITTSAHQKNLKLFLNQAGTCTFWMHLLDSKCDEIQEHTTCIVCYRNGKAIWSGPVYDCIEKAGATEEQLQVTANGWFQETNKRIVHTGLEWQEMAILHSGRIITRYPTEREKEIAEIESLYTEIIAEKSYVPLATESALELFYNVEKSQFSTIAADLITRANIDVPMKFSVGAVPVMNNLNFKIPQFHPLGELLNQLATIESGFDWEIDPLTRKFNMYYNAIRGGIAGKGIDRGSGVRFTYPGNCIMAERNAMGTKTQNRTEAVGQYGVGKSEDVQSIQERGLFEASENLSDVTNINILIAYAQAQVEYLKKPFTVISFTPKSINAQDNIITSVPRPFEDYELGDIVYTTIERGNRFRVGIENPQPVRIYGMNVDIDDNGIERISGLQTTYSS